jgi:hypothetical protein
VKPALGAGDLNKMFERIVREAPGNHTLSDEDRKELEEKGLTEYTVTVLSSPSDDVSASSRKAKASLWIITFDNFLTPEEAQAIIIPWLEEQDWIAGYAWFPFKPTGAPGAILRPCSTMKVT